MLSQDNINKVYPDQGRRFFVAMSGGVDSSVAALLLKQQGYYVVGVYMKNWSEPVLGRQCPWERDQEDARRAAEKLDIPFYTFDFEKEYKAEVVNYMIREYQAGRTPNPDVICNKIIKFGLFLDKALALGADYIATGHYARKRELKVKNSKLKVFELMSGIDKQKDQTYFLWTLTQDQLRHCIFPIGDFTKQEIRAIAKQAGLPTAGKPDSQGVCFIGEFSMQDFLKQYIPIHKGDVVAASGRKVGEHQGASFYTIGQRHGIGIGGGMPYYVSAKDIDSNTLTVAEGSEDISLFKSELDARDVNWISGKMPSFPLRCQARIRYRQPLQPCRVEKLETRNSKIEIIRIFFDQPQRAITPGQSVVFYDDNGELMLGGGVIDS